MEKKGRGHGYPILSCIVPVATIQLEVSEKVVPKSIDKETNRLDSVDSVDSIDNSDNLDNITIKCKSSTFAASQTTQTQPPDLDLEFHYQLKFQF